MIRAGTQGCILQAFIPIGLFYLRKYTPYSGVQTSVYPPWLAIVMMDGCQIQRFRTVHEKREHSTPNGSSHQSDKEGGTSRLVASCAQWDTVKCPKTPCSAESHLPDVGYITHAQDVVRWNLAEQGQLVANRTLKGFCAAACKHVWLQAQRSQHLQTCSLGFCARTSR